MVMEKVIQYIGTQVGKDSGLELGAETDLLESGLIDSTAVMDLVVWLEDTFGISVEAEDLIAANFGTPRKIADYVEKSRKE